MKNAYTILGLKTLQDNSLIDDKLIKQAYLQKVQQHPPEQNAEQFRLIRQAYEFLKDEKSRTSYALFHIEYEESAEVLEALFSENQRFTPSQSQFLNALKESLSGQWVSK